MSLAEFSSADAALSCADIVAERQRLTDGIAAANGRIEQNRTQNQVAGYFGALFIVPYLATEGNYTEKDEVARLYQRQDTLIKLAKVKGCAAPS